MDPIETVAKVYEAFESGDFESILALTHDDVVITQDDRLPYGGRFVGPDGVAEFALGLVGTSQSEVRRGALFEADGDVYQYGRTVGTVIANGAPFDIPEVHRWTVRDGKVAAAHFAIDTTAMLAAIDAPGTDDATG